MPKVHGRSSEVRPAQAHDPEFIRAVFTLSAKLRRDWGFQTSEWREALYFLCRYAETLDIDPEELEASANLNSLLYSDASTTSVIGENGMFEFSDEVNEKLFEDRLRHWFSNTLSQPPSAARPYVNKRTREWFLTVATILKAIFPDAVRHKPIWNSPRHRKTLKKVTTAWLDEQDRRCRSEASSKT